MKVLFLLWIGLYSASSFASGACSAWIPNPNNSNLGHWNHNGILMQFKYCPGSCMGQDSSTCSEYINPWDNCGAPKYLGIQDCTNAQGDISGYCSCPEYGTSWFSNLTQENKDACCNVAAPVQPTTGCANWSGTAWITPAYANDFTEVNCTGSNGGAATMGCQNSAGVCFSTCPISCANYGTTAFNSYTQAKKDKCCTLSTSNPVNPPVNPPTLSTQLSFTFTPPSYGFGNVNVNQLSNPKTIVIQNTSIKNASGCTVSLTDTVNYTLSGNCGSINSGATCAVTLKAKPTATINTNTQIKINCTGAN